MIVRSRAKCLRCDQVVESKSRHDFVSCPCGGIFLDGGLDYIRYGWDVDVRIELMTEYDDDEASDSGEPG